MNINSCDIFGFAQSLQRMHVLNTVCAIVAATDCRNGCSDCCDGDDQLLRLLHCVLACYLEINCELISMDCSWHCQFVNVSIVFHAVAPQHVVCFQVNAMCISW